MSDQRTLSNLRHAWRRRLPLIVVAGAVATAFLAAPAPMPLESIAAARLEIVRESKPMLILDADDRGGIVRLLNVDGWEIITLRADADGHGLIVLRTERGRQSAALQSSERGGQVMLFRAADEPGIAVDADGLTHLAPQPPDDAPGSTHGSDAMAAISQAIASLEKRHASLEQLVGDLARIAPTSATGDTRRTIEELNRRVRVQEEDLSRFESLVKDQERTLADVRRDVTDLERRLRD